MNETIQQIVENNNNAKKNIIYPKSKEVLDKYTALLSPYISTQISSDFLIGINNINQKMKGYIDALLTGELDIMQEMEFNTVLNKQFLELIKVIDNYKAGKSIVITDTQKQTHSGSLVPKSGSSISNPNHTNKIDIQKPANEIQRSIKDLIEKIDRHDYNKFSDLIKSYLEDSGIPFDIGELDEIIKGSFGSIKELLEGLYEVAGNDDNLTIDFQTSHLSLLKSFNNKTERDTYIKQIISKIESDFDKIDDDMISAFPNVLSVIKYQLEKAEFTGYPKTATTLVDLVAIYISYKILKVSGKFLFNIVSWPLRKVGIMEAKPKSQSSESTNSSSNSERVTLTNAHNSLITEIEADINNFNERETKKEIGKRGKKIVSKLNELLEDVREGGDIDKLETRYEKITGESGWFKGSNREIYELKPKEVSFLGDTLIVRSNVESNLEFLEEKVNKLEKKENALKELNNLDRLIDLENAETDTDEKKKYNTEIMNSRSRLTTYGINSSELMSKANVTTKITSINSDITTITNDIKALLEKIKPKKVKIPTDFKKINIIRWVAKNIRY